jgi:hypothetical protein
MTQILCILALAFSPQEDGGKPDEAKLRALIEKLDADDADVRGRAERELAGMDEAIVPLLEKSRTGASVEARSRLDRVIGDLTLARRWVKDLSGDEQEGMQAYSKLEQSIRNKSLDRRQAGRIVKAALVSQTVSDDVRHTLYSLAERNQLVEVWPALLELLSRDDQEANYALNSLQRLKLPKEATDDFLKAIPKVRNRSNINSILDLLVRLKPERTKLDPVVQSLLEEADDSSIYTITSYLSNGRLQVSLKTALKCWNGKNRTIRQSVGREVVLRVPPDESLKEVLDLLSSADWEDVSLAADYVARHRVRQAAAPLVDSIQKQQADDRQRLRRMQPYEATQLRSRLVAAFRSLGPEELIKGWLSAGGPPSRLSLVVLIGELDLRTLVGEVVEALSDKDAQVRQAAARSLATRPHPDAGTKLEALLKDESVPVRRAALQSLAAAKGAAATATVLAQLRSDQPDVQAMAVEVLPSMNLDLVLDDLTKEASLGNAMTRYALAALVATHGDTVLHRVIARVGGKVSIEELQGMVRLIQSARGVR